MKKLLLLLSIIAILSACKTEDPVKVSQYVGTKWTATDDIAHLVYGGVCTTTVEFLTGTTCQEIDIRSGMNYGAGSFVTPGVCVLKGDSVSWTVGTTTIKGKITGSAMTTTMGTLAGGNRVYTKN